MIERARAPREQKRALRESVQVESLEHQLRVMAHMLSNPHRVHSVGSVCEELEHDHEDGLVLHHNIYLLIESKKLRHNRDVSGLEVAN